MAVLRMKAAVDQLLVLLSHGARHTRSSMCAYSSTSQQRTTGDKTTGGGAAAGGDGGDDDDKGGGDHQCFAMKSLQKKNVKLEEEIRDLTERYRKAAADSERIRNRTRKFVEDAKLFGIQSLCRDLVEVADILEQGVDEANQKEMTDLSEALSSVEGKLRIIFTKHGLRKMTPVGENYDPYDHEVVCHVPAEGIKPGNVATIRQHGYKLHGRTVRHARVGLAVETPKR